MANDESYGAGAYEFGRHELEGSDAEEDRRIRRVLGRYDKNAKSSVERAYKRWNQTVRDWLRSETALRFVLGEERQAIPIKIIDGMPQPFRDIVKEYDDIWWEIYLNRKLLERSLDGLSFTAENYGRIIQFQPDYQNLADEEHILKTAEMIKRLLELQPPKPDREKGDLVERIRKIRQDILGAYFFRIPEIQLYWMVIGVLSNAIGVTIEALTFVVLTHELAHAYTHRGLDIDGEKWDTDAFAATSVFTVEGLAQFYTYQVCVKANDRLPEAKKAFDGLLAMQADPYTEFKGWLEPADKTGEVVRFSLLQARKRNILHYPAFMKLLQETRNQVAGINR